MNQIIGAVILFGIVTAVFAPLIAESGSQIFSNSLSISDAMEISQGRTGQIIVATNTQQQGGVTSIFLSNIGIGDVEIHAVLIDGIEAPHVLYDQDDIPVAVFVPGELATLKVTGTGQAVQVITTIGKLFEFAAT